LRGGWKRPRLFIAERPAGAAGDAGASCNQGAFLFGLKRGLGGWSFMFGWFFWLLTQFSLLGQLLFSAD
jgi:hypothetical protein